MAGIRDRDFLTACARLASCLNLSAAAARQRVDVQARKDGIRDPKEKLALVERLLEEAKQVYRSPTWVLFGGWWF